MKVAIIEDNARLLESLALLLSNEEGITVAGAFSRGGEALGALRAGSADVVLIDLSLPGMDGIELIGKFKAALPEAVVLLYTVFAERARTFAALKAGANGYVFKGTTIKELAEALRRHCRRAKSGDRPR